MLPQLAAVLARIADIRVRLGGLGDPAAGQECPAYRAQGSDFAQTLAEARSATAPPAASRSGNTSPPSAFEGLIRAAAARHGVDADLVHAVIQAESDYDPTCRSSAGAMGLMQLMPGTARALGVGNAWDPARNIEGGVKYLRQQLDRFHEVDLALAAYNAGPGAVARHGGVPPYRETQAYVRRVMQTLWQRKGQ